MRSAERMAITTATIAKERIMIQNLTHAEWGVIKGLVHGGGSTSEGLTQGFVTGNLKQFSGHYVRFVDAWERLDSCQKQAVITIRQECQYGDEVNDVNELNFVSKFIAWERRKLFAQKEQAFWDRWHKHPNFIEYYENGELPPREHKKIEASVKRTLSKHI
ncbi:TPA: hypothetical protein RQJ82_002188 [Vibrio vulnificus]|nr:hypothetical protein [Vibrio vulnificus]HDZ3715744.1 hypothetical protein [Vibrio vulnificus]